MPRTMFRSLCIFITIYIIYSLNLKKIPQTFTFNFSKFSYCIYKVISKFRYILFKVISAILGRSMKALRTPKNFPHYLHNLSIKLKKKNPHTFTFNFSKFSYSIYKVISKFRYTLFKVIGANLGKSMKALRAPKIKIHPSPPLFWQKTSEPTFHLRGS